MRQRLRSHLTYANVVSTLCLFLLLGGTAVAVDGSLPGQNTVGSADIINGEVKNADLGSDSVGSGKIPDGQVKNSDLGPNAVSSSTIADGGIQGIDVKNSTLTGAQVADHSLTRADIDESLLTDPLAPAVNVCRTDGPLHLVAESVQDVCTLGAFTVSAQCALDVSDPIAMINVTTSVDHAFIVFGPDTNAVPDFSGGWNVFSVSSRTGPNTTGPQAAKQGVLFAAPDGSQLVGTIGARAVAVSGSGDSCDFVVSLIG